MMFFCFALLSLSSVACLGGVSVSGDEAPNRVSISVDGPMFEARRYTLTCTVQDVAPVKNLAVTFYRGKTPLGQPLFSNNTQTEPVTQVYTQSIVPSKEDDGAQYWCEAKLQLEPQRPLVVTSRYINATVYYKPQVTHPPQVTMTVTAGQPVELNCSARGNPRPSYAWTVPDRWSPSSGSVLAISSVAFEDNGRYTCDVSNSAGATTVSFQLQVRGDFTRPIIIFATGISLVVIVAIVLFCIFRFTWL